MSRKEQIERFGKGLSSAYGIAEVHVPVCNEDVDVAIEWLVRHGKRVSRKTVADLLRSAGAEGIRDLNLNGD